MYPYYITSSVNDLGVRLKWRQGSGPSRLTCGATRDRAGPIMTGKSRISPGDRSVVGQVNVMTRKGRHSQRRNLFVSGENENGKVGALNLKSLLRTQRQEAKQEGFRVSA